MNRRHFLAAAAATIGTPLLTPVNRLSADIPADFNSDESHLQSWRCFKLTTRVVLPDGSGAAQLFLPLAQTAGNYQVACDPGWSGSGQTEIVHDTRYGAPLLRTTWKSDESGPLKIEATQTVITRWRQATRTVPLTDAERRFWLTPAGSEPVNPAVTETAARITADDDRPIGQLAAIYDWVVDHTYRNPDVAGCGTGSFGADLSGRKLGGKCVDINGLLVALARAAGLPAREVYGIRVAESRDYPSLGRSGDITKSQHCRAEVFLDGQGWYPLDAADVRKVVLEQKMTLDGQEGRTLRASMFGGWEENWVSYNSAARIELPGAGTNRPDFRFLMYPCAFTEKGQRSCLDPAKFHYEIASRELKKWA